MHVCFFQVEGIQGIMVAYSSALQNVSLAGPTLFGPIITNAASIASQSLANGGQKYFVLLIITVSIMGLNIRVYNIPSFFCLLQFFFFHFLDFQTQFHFTILLP